MGWARAEMAADELRGCKKNPLQERLCLFVHIRRQVLDVQRLEILALAGLDEHNAKAIEASLESYRRKVFGKQPTKVDEFAEGAKRQLAEEAKKLYLVTPKATNKGLEQLQTAAKSHNPEVARMAQMLLAEERRAMSKLKPRISKIVPAGVVTEKR